MFLWFPCLKYCLKTLAAQVFFWPVVKWLLGCALRSIKRTCKKSTTFLACVTCSVIQLSDNFLISKAADNFIIMKHNVIGFILCLHLNSDTTAFLLLTKQSWIVLSKTVRSVLCPGSLPDRNGWISKTNVTNVWSLRKIM